jgi:hypothetical protein
MGFRITFLFLSFLAFNAYAVGVGRGGAKTG